MRLLAAILGAHVVVLATAASAGAADASRLRVHLEEIRRDPAKANDPREIDELVRETDGQCDEPECPLALELAATAYAERLGRPESARTQRERILVEMHPDAVTAAKVARDLVDAALAEGDVGAAEGALAKAGGRATPDTVARVARAEKRRVAHRVSIAAVSAMLAPAAIALYRARREAWRAARSALGGVVVFGLWVGLGGTALARSYEASDPRPFLFLGGALVPTVLVARAWGAAGSASRPARVLRTVTCACAALAVAFLVLERTNVQYLEGIGL